MTRRLPGARVWLAGPVSVVVGVLVMLGMPLWLPAGTAEIDNLVLPLLLFPLVWSVLFFHACLDTDLRRVAVVALTLATLHGGLIAWHFLSPPVKVTVA